MHQTRLPPCPSSPNCVSSEADTGDARHHLPPLRMPEQLALGAAMDAVEAALRSQPRVRIVTRSDTFLHATDTSRLFRFVDDVHVRIDAGARMLHVRSASRVGYGDMGVNRKRATALMQALAAAWGVAWPGAHAANR